MSRFIFISQLTTISRRLIKEQQCYGTLARVVPKINEFNITGAET